MTQCVQNGNATKGLFAAGDAAGNPRMVSHAIGAGKRAALAMDIYLTKEMTCGMDVSDATDIADILAAVTVGHGGVLSSRKYRKEKTEPADAAPGIPVTQPEYINLAHIISTPGVAVPILAADARRGCFDEINPGWSAEQSAREAQRCLSCGTCVTCGVCQLFCPDMAVTANPHSKAQRREEKANPHAKARRREAKNNLVEFDYEHCKGCGICVRECPRGAIDLIEEDK